MTFPADAFTSMADHAAWRARHESTLAARALSDREAPPERPGTCAPCGRATTFRNGACDCEERLDPQARALLHAIDSEAGFAPWSRLLWVGRDTAVRRRLAGAVVAVGPAEIVVVDPLPAAVAGDALRAVRGTLAPGGCLLAPLDLDPELRHGGGGRFGWDVLDACGSAGFASARVLRPWSRELGYPDGIWILKAVA